MASPRCCAQSARVKYLTLADWAQQRGDATEAQDYYQRALKREPANEEALLGLAELYAYSGNPLAARAQLAKLPAASAPLH